MIIYKITNKTNGKRYIGQTKHDVARKLKVSRDCVKNVLSGKQESAKGYIFKRI